MNEQDGVRKVPELYRIGHSTQEVLRNHHDQITRINIRDSKFEISRATLFEYDRDVRLVRALRDYSGGTYSTFRYPVIEGHEIAVETVYAKDRKSGAWVLKPAGESAYVYIPGNSNSRPDFSFRTDTNGVNEFPYIPDAFKLPGRISTGGVFTPSRTGVYLEFDNQGRVQHFPPSAYGKLPERVIAIASNITVPR